MARMLILFVYFASFVVSLSAEPPKAIINGPVTGIAGELLVLDASKSTGEPTHFKWMVEPELPGRKMFESDCDRNSRIRICSIPGAYRYTLVVSNADGADLLFWDISIPGSPPPSPTPPGPAPTPVPPNPGPSPNPDPEPLPPDPPSPDVVPDGRFGIAPKIVEWSVAVTSPTKLKDAAGFANSFESVASAIAAGGISDANAIVQTLLRSNRAEVGQQVIEEHWLQFGKLMQSQLAAAYSANKLKTGDDWSTYLRECAVGFRGIR